MTTPDSDLVSTLAATHAPAAAAPSEARHASDEVLVPPSLALRVGNVVAIVLPFLGLVAAFILLWGVAFSWVYLWLLLAGYLFTTLGITIGYHRLFTHKAFGTSALVKVILGALGSMAVQGPILQWVATHRRHHQHSDSELDPHSPNVRVSRPLAIIRAFFHAHWGWFFTPAPQSMSRYVPDLAADPVVRITSKLFLLWVLLGLLIPAAVAGAVTGTWLGALLGLIWGGLVRVFLVHHITWSVNSVCHLWGARPYASHDHSRNNAIFGILALGEGWHNNHHAFPTSARHGLKWWQLDLTYLAIRALAVVGLAWDIRLPTPERLAAKAVRRT